VTFLQFPANFLRQQTGNPGRRRCPKI